LEFIKDEDNRVTSILFNGKVYSLDSKDCKRFDASEKDLRSYIRDCVQFELDKAIVDRCKKK